MEGVEGREGLSDQLSGLSARSVNEPVISLNAYTFGPLAVIPSVS